MPTCGRRKHLDPVLIRSQQVLSSGPWSYLPAVAVDVILHIHTHGTGALIQDGELRLVVEQSGHLGPAQRQ